jgi:hypothetical protein
MNDFLIRALATLVGALAAFGLAAWREKRKERSQQIARFRSALFALLMQRTFLRNLKSQYLDAKRDLPIRAYGLHPAVGHVPPTETVDPESLAFLLGVAEGELLNRLVLAQSQCQGVVALLAARNPAHMSFQEKLEVAQQSRQVQEGTIDDLRAIAGTSLRAQLERMTDDLYRFTDDAIDSNRDVYVAAVAAFRRLFPEAGLFGVEDVPLGSQKNGAA